MTTSDNRRVIQPSEHDGLIAMYKAGSTLAAVGVHFGLSPERVRQIVRAAGVSKLHGGKAISLLKETPAKVANLRSKNERAEAEARSSWGMSLDDYRIHVAQHGSSCVPNSPLSKYRQQRTNARVRGIAWNFTFPEWWSVWQESGKWDQRGKGGYVMARYGDGDTPYSKDTVYICTQSENSKDGYIVTPGSIRGAKTSQTCAAKRSKQQA